jgi:hypothetical protein
MACAPDLCACPQGSARATEKPLAYAKENMNIKREDRLHIIEILAIVVIGFFQIRLAAEQNRISERLNAEPIFSFEYAAEATALKVFHIPNAHILIQPSSAFVIPEGMIHKLSVANEGTVKATQVYIKAAISEGQPFRFAIVAVRNDATGIFLPEDEWRLHFIDAKTLKYAKIWLQQVSAGDRVSIFFAFAYPGAPHSGRETNALIIETTAAEQHIIGQPSVEHFPIWYRL